VHPSDDPLGRFTAEEVIDRMGLAPHPEGGHYREVWRAEGPAGTRGAGSSIYFLLAAGERSWWHRVDADEIWYFHAGAALELYRTPDETTVPITARLGLDLAAGEMPQWRVPRLWWQAAESTGDWTLVSCAVAPAFQFEGFDLAPPDFRPGP
jgi:predicted cupin superfamily sugar epimerase